MIKNEFLEISNRILSDIEKNLDEFVENSFAENLDLFKAGVNELYEQDYFNIRRFLNLLIDMKTQIMIDVSTKNVQKCKIIFLDEKTHFQSLFCQKNEEYSRYSEELITDVLNNFKMPSEEFNIDTSEKRVLLGYVLKHFTSLVQIFNFIKKDIENDNYMSTFVCHNKLILNEKFGDIFIYMLLLNAIEQEL